MPPTHQQRLAQRVPPSSFRVMKQRWAGLGFFHWALDPAVLATLIPHGLHLDTFEGKAWLGIIPFFMQRVRPTGLPPLPWLSWFHELNVRTYVFDDLGNPGVWFLSLDCNQPIAVEIARHLFNLPYQHARISSSSTPSEIHYHSLRKGSPLGDASFRYPTPTAPQPAAEHSLDWFLVERYRLFSANKKGSLFSGIVHHSPYLIEPVKSAEISTIPFALNGLPQPSHPPDSLLCAAPVDVTIFPLKKV